MNCPNQALPKLHIHEQNKYCHRFKPLSVGVFCSVAVFVCVYIFLFICIFMYIFMYVCIYVYGALEKASGQAHTQLRALLCELRMQTGARAISRIAGGQ